MKLSEHFDSNEFACKCGCGYQNNGRDIDPRLVEILEHIRHYVGDVPLIISSGLRCPIHNANEGGTPKSYHLQGKAADISCPKGLTPIELKIAARKAGADGIGLYAWGIHIDTRGYDAEW